MLLVTQIITTINISYTKKENIYGEINFTSDENSYDYKASNNRFIFNLA